MTDDIRAKIIAEIREFIGTTARQPNDITSDDLAREIGCGETTARAILRKMVDAGKATRVKVQIDGRLRTAYRIHQEK